MARFTAEQPASRRARREDVIARYPVRKSALIPLLHLAQEQDGHVTDDAMAHIAELVGVTPAEVLGTCSFYEMFKREPVGDYVVNVCTNISCMLLGGEELLRPPRAPPGHQGRRHDARREVHARGRRVHRGLHRGAVPAGQLPLLPQITNDEVDVLIDDLRAGKRAHEVPRHGTLSRVRQQLPDTRAGVAPPDRNVEPPGWRATTMRRRRRSRDRRRHDHGHERTSARSRASSPRAGTWPTATPSTATRSGGYSALRQALADMTPAQVAEQVKAASLLGRGGAGFPAGVKWGFCPPGVFPRYIVVNGDESEPGTYKDRILMERDPHQLIEGVLLACYAIGASQAFLYVRGEMALAQERLAEALNDAYAAGYDRAPHPRHRLLGRHRAALGRGRLHRRRGDRPHRVARGQPGHAPPQAAVLPGGQGPVHAAHGGQQRRDAVEPPVDRQQRRGRLRRPRRRELEGHPPVRGVGPRPQPGRVRGRVRRHDLPRHHLRRAVRRRHPRRQPPQGLHPRRCVRPVVLRGAPRPAARGRRGRRGRVDARLGRHRRHGRDHRRGQGRLAGRAVLRPRVVRQVHARAARARRGSRRSCGACSTGTAGPTDVDKLLDICDNISPAIAWPPKQTTICPLGPSAVSPIASAVLRFRDEFARLLRRVGRGVGADHRQGVPVDSPHRLRGAAQP